jgi:hypothetical protein
MWAPATLERVKKGWREEANTLYAVQQAPKLAANMAHMRDTPAWCRATWHQGRPQTTTPNATVSRVVQTQHGVEEELVLANVSVDEAANEDNSTADLDGYTTEEWDGGEEELVLANVSVDEAANEDNTTADLDGYTTEEWDGGEEELVLANVSVDEAANEDNTTEELDGYTTEEWDPDPSTPPSTPPRLYASLQLYA